LEVRVKKTPMRAKSLKSPAPTLSYGIEVCSMKGMLPSEEEEVKKDS